jgi:uncharacterized protein YndB with AHSA1/START domain
VSQNRELRSPIQKKNIMPDLRHIVPVQAAPDRVYAAVATEAGMRSWWTADTQMEEKVGGKAEFGFDNRQFVFRMTIEKLDPDRCVIMRCHGDAEEWNSTMLRWDVSQGNGATTLCFVHSGWRELTDFCSSCNAMWGNLMFRLKDSVEGNGRGPQWP